MECIDLCKNIKALRLSRGLTQKDVAVSLGVTRAFYAHLERGDKILRMDRFLEICVVFDVDPYFFFPKANVPIVRRQLRVRVAEIADNVPKFTIKDVAFSLNVKYHAANGAISALIKDGVLKRVDVATYARAY